VAFLLSFCFFFSLFRYTADIIRAVRIQIMAMEPTSNKRILVSAQSKPKSTYKREKKKKNMHWLSLDLSELDASVT
jgi:hypothetical protein